MNGWRHTLTLTRSLSLLQEELYGEMCVSVSPSLLNASPLFSLWHSFIGCLVCLCTPPPVSSSSFPLPYAGARRTHVNACLLTVSDRASQGVYEDLSGPAMRQVLENKVRGGLRPLPAALWASWHSKPLQPGKLPLSLRSWPGACHGCWGRNCFGAVYREQCRASSLGCLLPPP